MVQLGRINLLRSQIKKMRPEMPVILCTGNGERFSEENPAKLSVDDFLMKPVGKADLAKALRTEAHLPCGCRCMEHKERMRHESKINYLDCR